MKTEHIDSEDNTTFGVQGQIKSEDIQNNAGIIQFILYIIQHYFNSFTSICIILIEIFHLYITYLLTQHTFFLDWTSKNYPAVINTTDQVYRPSYYVRREYVMRMKCLENKKNMEMKILKTKVYKYIPLISLICKVLKF